MSLSRLRPEITKTNRMEFNLKIWRQKNAKAKGHFETYHIEGIEEDASFLEMLDILNEQIIREAVLYLLITTAVKVFAVLAHCILTVALMVQTIM